MSDELTGRELDAAVAEKVFGWQWISYDGKKAMLVSHDPVYGTVSEAELRMAQREKSEDIFRLPAYSTTWEGLGLVVEEMGRRQRPLGLYAPYEHKDYWEAYFYSVPSSGPYAVARGATAPETVARAALKALEPPTK